MRTWWEFLNELWKFIRKYGDTDRSWEKVMREAERIYHRFHDRKAFRDILFAVIEEWEQEGRAQ